MIITGAPVETLDFEQVDYWPELCSIMDFSRTNVYSTLHVCWGCPGGAVLSLWGAQAAAGSQDVRCLSIGSPGRQILVRGFDEVFYTPHSRHTGVSRGDIDACGELRILAESDAAGPVSAEHRGRAADLCHRHLEYDQYTPGCRIPA